MYINNIFSMTSSFYVYKVASFLDKNRDILRSDLQDLLLKSQSKVVCNNISLNSISYHYHFWDSLFPSCSVKLCNSLAQGKLAVIAPHLPGNERRLFPTSFLYPLSI